MDTPVTLGQLMMVVGLLLNLLATLGGLGLIYVRVIERITKVETDMQHVLGALGASRRVTDAPSAHGVN